jgi:hypothetical protein
MKVVLSYLCSAILDCMIASLKLEAFVLVVFGLVEEMDLAL